MNSNLDYIQSQFQAVASVFVKERDEAVANLNKLLYSEQLNVKKITKEIRKLTEAKMNLVNTEQELSKVINKIHQMKNEPEATDANKEVGK